MADEIFEYFHQNANIVRDATSIDDFIVAFENHLQFFKELKEAGVKLDLENSDVGSDYTILTTSNADVASKYGFEPQDTWIDDYDYEDEDLWEEETIE